MINHQKSYYLSLGVALSLAVLFSDVALAADCKILHDGIRKERVLMEKKVLVEAALKACPDDPGIVYQSGYIFERLRKYKAALVSYRKAVALDSGYAKAYFSIGDIETLQKNYREALDAYTEGLRYEPGNDRARASLKLVQAKYQGVTTAKKAPAVPVVTAQVSPVMAGKKVALPKSAPAVASKFAVAPITRLNVPFNQKTADLSQDAQDVLSVVVGQAMNRKDMRSNRFEVAGHTDNLGDADKNYAISKKRAIAVQKYLTEGYGINPDRLKIASYGQKKPKVPNNSQANQAINRRVDFIEIDKE